MSPNNPGLDEHFQNKIALVRHPTPLEVVNAIDMLTVHGEEMSSHEKQYWRKVIEAGSSPNPPKSSS